MKPLDVLVVVLSVRVFFASAPELLSAFEARCIAPSCIALLLTGIAHHSDFAADVPWCVTR